MTRTLKKRLDDLEAKIAKRQAVQLEIEQRSTQHLVRTAIGQYLGEPQPNEEPCQVIARGLGYKDTNEMGMALSGDGHDYPKRWRQAVRRLFAQFGADVDGDEEEFRDALEQMKAGFSNSFQVEYWRSELESR